MSSSTVRIFEQPSVRLFQLSPLYAEPGWYGTVDAIGTVGPYSSEEQVRQILENVAAQQPERPTLD